VTAYLAHNWGKAVGITAKLHVSNNTIPCVCRARPAPHALHKRKSGTRITYACNLTVRGVIKPVEMSEWEAPIVPVLKLDETICIYKDYHLMVN